MSRNYGSVFHLRMLSSLVAAIAGPPAHRPAHLTLRTSEALMLRPCNDALVQPSLFHRLCSRHRWLTMLHTWVGSCQASGDEVAVQFALNNTEHVRQLHGNLGRASDGFTSRSRGTLAGSTRHTNIRARMKTSERDTV
jgi:hypothetical protein